MSKLVLSLPLWALISTLPALAARAGNIVVNGDFEGSTFTEYGDTLPSGWGLSPTNNASLSNCGVSSVVNSAMDLGPESGTHYMTFQSRETDGSQDCLYQDLPTIAGQQYLVTFSVAITSGIVGSTSFLDPEWDSGGANDSYMRSSYYYPPSSTSGPVPYETFSFTETASKNTTRIYLHGVDSSGGSILVDNVSVSAAPEPSAVVLLALGAAVLYRRRGR